MWNGYYMARTAPVSGFVFWHSVLRTGIYDGMTVTDYLEFAEDYIYDCEFYNYTTHEEITFENEDTALISTGMVAMSTYNNNIYYMSFIVKFGDITGGDGIGDGLVDSADSFTALNFALGSGGLSNYLLVMAGDINGTGLLDTNDALSIAGYISGNNTIDQGVTRSIPDGIYYTTPVSFS